MFIIPSNEATFHILQLCHCFSVLQFCFLVGAILSLSTHFRFPFVVVLLVDAILNAASLFCNSTLLFVVEALLYFLAHFRFPVAMQFLCFLFHFDLVVKSVIAVQLLCFQGGGGQNCPATPLCSSRSHYFSILPSSTLQR